MSAVKVDSEVAAVIQAAVEKHGTSHDAFIPILSEINYALGHIPGDAFREVCRQLKTADGQVHVAESQLYGLASFYDMISTKPRGRHVIKFCENAPCHVVGGKAVWDTLQETLGLTSGQTTVDSRWTLVTTSCLGLCSVGPVVLVDDDIYGNVTPDQVSEILERYE